MGKKAAAAIGIGALTIGGAVAAYFLLREREDDVQVGEARPWDFLTPAGKRTATKKAKDANKANKIVDKATKQDKKKKQKVSWWRKIAAKARQKREAEAKVKAKLEAAARAKKAKAKAEATAARAIRPAQPARKPIKALLKLSRGDKVYVAKDFPYGAKFITSPKYGRWYVAKKNLGAWAFALKREAPPNLQIVIVKYNSSREFQSLVVGILASAGLVQIRFL